MNCGAATSTRPDRADQQVRVNSARCSYGCGNTTLFVTWPLHHFDIGMEFGGIQQAIFSVRYLRDRLPAVP